MFGRLLRVTGTVLVIAVAFVTPVLVTSTPASADTVINGCTIVSNPTSTNFTNCPGFDFVGANLSGLDLSFANLAGSVFAACSTTTIPPTCLGVDVDNSNLTQANLSGITAVAFTTILHPLQAYSAGAAFAGANLSGSNLTNVTFYWNFAVGTVSATLTGANLTGANVTGSSFVPLNQSVTATSQAGAVATWSTPTAIPGATPGSCTPASGSTFPIGTTTVTCQVLDNNGDVATGTFQVNVMPPPTTSVLLPANGATVSEGTWLDAAASSPVGIASVTFEVSGGSISDMVISSGYPTLYGYIGGWDTRDVPNGTYTLQSVATDARGVSTTSATITVTVDNGPLSTTVVVWPSSLDPTQGYVLDAIASAGATGLSFQLNEGGGVLATVTATDTLYGWIYDEPPTPNSGCAMLTPPQTCSPASLPATIQSVATYPDGTSVTSAAVNTDVVIQCVEPNVGCVPAA